MFQYIRVVFIVEEKTDGINTEMKEKNNAMESLIGILADKTKRLAQF